MKAFTIASLSALALVGVACSEATPVTQTETGATPEAASETPTSTEDTGFNLDLFDEGSGDDGFNIGFEDEPSDPLTGFDFGDDAGSELLSDIPTIETPSGLSQTEELVKLPELSAPADEDELIRLPE